MKNNLLNKTNYSILEQNLAKYKDRLSNDRILPIITQYTGARLAIGNSGGHIKTNTWLQLFEEYAQAKDALESQLELVEISKYLTNKQLDYIKVDSLAVDHLSFLQRPDLGRKLSKQSEDDLEHYFVKNDNYINSDILIIVSGGLSAIAINHQLSKFLDYFIPYITQMQWSLAPIILNQKGRVALMDNINKYAKAKVVVMLIGERPGLSSYDGMSIYLTFRALPGFTDEKRNCISNIHAKGLDHKTAALKLSYLIMKALTLKLSGIELKDDFDISKVEQLAYLV